MQNEYYYLNELENKMNEFVENECSDGSFRWMPDNLQRRMAEAAFAVLKNSVELNQYLEKEGLIK